MPGLFSLVLGWLANELGGIKLCFRPSKSMHTRKDIPKVGLLKWAELS